MSASRPTLAELQERCQKPDHRRTGNWMARRISRPLALRVTWLIAPWGVSAHAATLLAWITAVAAAAAFGAGTQVGWICGAALLQFWYLLDHVDGQLARYHGAASLDGVQLDYLMHHTVNLLAPLGIGYGLCVHSEKPAWLIVSCTWAVASLLLGLQHDCRYKAFTQRLKRVRGELRLIGGGGARPTPAARPPMRILKLSAWLVRKACEIHVVMNVLAMLALAQWLSGDERLYFARCYVCVMALLASVSAAVAIWRSTRDQLAETEFALWYQPPAGRDLVFADGWWWVLAATETEAMSAGSDAEEGAGTYLC
jgi:hypothetical protein